MDNNQFQTKLNKVMDGMDELLKDATFAQAQALNRCAVSLQKSATGIIARHVMNAKAFMSPKKKE